MKGKIHLIAATLFAVSGGLWLVGFLKDHSMDGPVRLVPAVLFFVAAACFFLGWWRKPKGHEEE